MSDSKELPDIVQRVSEAHPELWEAFQRLGAASGASGPIEGETARLVKLALAVGARMEGAVHAHVRKAKREGIDDATLRHVALLAITTLGWPHAMAALTWIEDLLPDGA